jgi:hypothetical protein
LLVGRARFDAAEMARRYAHLAPTPMAKHAAVIGALPNAPSMLANARIFGEIGFPPARSRQLMLQFSIQAQHTGQIADRPRNKKSNYDHS